MLEALTEHFGHEVEPKSKKVPRALQELQDQLQQAVQEGNVVNMRILRSKIEEKEAEIAVEAELEAEAEAKRQTKSKLHSRRNEMLLNGIQRGDFSLETMQRFQKMAVEDSIKAIELYYKEGKHIERRKLLEEAKRRGESVEDVLHGRHNDVSMKELLDALALNDEESDGISFGALNRTKSNQRRGSGDLFVTAAARSTNYGFPTDEFLRLTRNGRRTPPVGARERRDLLHDTIHNYTKGVNDRLAAADDKKHRFKRRNSLDDLEAQLSPGGQSNDSLRKPLLKFDAPAKRGSKHRRRSTVQKPDGEEEDRILEKSVIHFNSNFPFTKEMYVQALRWYGRIEDVELIEEPGQHGVGRRGMIRFSLLSKTGAELSSIKIGEHEVDVELEEWDPNISDAKRDQRRKHILEKLAIRAQGGSAQPGKGKRGKGKKGSASGPKSPRGGGPTARQRAKAAAGMEDSTMDSRWQMDPAGGVSPLHVDEEEKATSPARSPRAAGAGGMKIKGWQPSLKHSESFEDRRLERQKTHPKSLLMFPPIPPPVYAAPPSLPALFTVDPKLSMKAQEAAESLSKAARTETQQRRIEELRRQQEVETKRREWTQCRGSLTARTALQRTTVAESTASARGVSARSKQLPMMSSASPRRAPDGTYLAGSSEERRAHAHYATGSLDAVFPSPGGQHQQQQKPCSPKDASFWSSHVRHPYAPSPPTRYPVGGYGSMVAPRVAQHPKPLGHVEIGIASRRLAPVDPKGR